MLVCFATKAVHYELVSELTTTAFITTLRRFIGRRGIPSKIRSDNGTNFFTLEHAPHFVGLWDAAVKTFKVHVRKVIGEVRLNFEEFTTILVQVEACLNSRTLTPIPDASEALEVLTPSHFLMGRQPTTLPDEPDIPKITVPLKRWQLCQSLIRHL